VVDDEPTLLAAYRRMLGADHDVEVAPGGREAIARLDRDPTFDAIVCDLFMPGAGGGEVLAHLERHHPALCRRFVLSSAGAYTPGAAALAASLGDRFVGKPLEYGALRALVRRLAEG
jgi:CheY-like chemotaxis protein